MMHHDPPSVEGHEDGTWLPPDEDDLPASRGEVVPTRAEGPGSSVGRTPDGPAADRDQESVIVPRAIASREQMPASTISPIHESTGGGAPLTPRRQTARRVRVTPATGGTPAPGRRVGEVTAEATMGSGDSDDRWDSSPPPRLAPGEVVFGKFKLISLLGEGGMGQVWLVKNLELDKKRALKLISPKIARNDRGWRRFQREAQLMAKLEHPNAVTVHGFDCGQSTAYIEMAFVPGKSLAQVLDERAGRPMPLGDVALLVDQLGAVLQYAHSHVDEDTGKLKPIIHRDLKPSNLMLADGQPPGKNLRVLDFGIAKMVDDEEPEHQITKDGEYLGTASYSSPEQIREGVRNPKTGKAQEIDGRSDLYSLGVLLYQLLTGVLPFRSENLNAVIACHLAEPPPPMAEANAEAEVPAEVERVVMKCLEKDPAKRFRSARELAEAFRSAAAPHLTGIDGPPPAHLALAALAVLVVAVVASWQLWRGESSGPQGVKGGPVDTPSRVDALTKNASNANPAPVTSRLWEPEGYRAVDPKKSVAGEPNRLRRDIDSVEFVRWKEGIYLPVGYEPEESGNKDGDWPEAIIRSDDAKLAADERPRYIRIKGRTFLCGDPRQAPLQDCEPHHVTVRSLYIQETEVTNAEIEAFLNVHHEAVRDLRDWREYYGLQLQSDPTRARRYAAVAISYPVAREYARFRGGRLPTEAEWEFVGKSGGDDDWWSWGKSAPVADKPRAHLLGARVGSVPVKSFKGDLTQQGVSGMTGNVREWCLDEYRPLAQTVPKNNGPDHPIMDDPWRPDLFEQAKIDPARVFAVRGGSFKKTLDEAMVFIRDKVGADQVLDDLGFRVVIECPPTPAAHRTPE
jgi:serine/threonine-protein kinase